MFSFDSQMLLSNILKTIDSKGIKERDLLISTGLSANYLSDWKAGKNKSPGLEKIYRISNFLDVSLETLITGYETVTTIQETSSDLSIDEENLLVSYRSLDRDDKLLMQRAAIDICRGTYNEAFITDEKVSSRSVVVHDMPSPATDETELTSLTRHESKFLIMYRLLQKEDPDYIEDMETLTEMRYERIFKNQEEAALSYSDIA